MVLIIIDYDLEIFGIIAINHLSSHKFRYIKGSDNLRLLNEQEFFDKLYCMPV